MKLLFSEYKSDYNNYIFPYAVWAFPEAGEKPAQFFARGFLPASRTFERYYLCRHVRIRLAHFSPSSENRRILRKGKGITCTLVARNKFAYTSARRDFCKKYADTRFGPDVMSIERLDSLFNSPITTHVLVFEDTETGEEIGIVTLYMEEKELAYYYYGFYDLRYYPRNLGMYMMTSAVALFADMGIRYAYLGSCYSRNALYKTQFRGAGFFNGYCWSDNIDELKFLIRREQGPITCHLLENPLYLEEFAPDTPASLSQDSFFRIPL